MEEPRSSLELSPDALRRRTDPTRLPFQTTAGLPAPATMIGQERAHEAIDLALNMPDGHYNLYVVGQPGAGCANATLALVREAASKRQLQHDWVYVYNFELPEEPLALELPAGRGRTFAHDVELYITACRRELRRAFSSEVYDQRRDELLEEPIARHTHLLGTLQKETLALGFRVRGTPSGLVIDPLIFPPDGAEPVPMTNDAMNALTKDEQAQHDERRAKAISVVQQIMPAVSAIEEEARGIVRDLDHEVAESAVRHLSELIAASNAAFPPVLEYLKRLRADVVAHALILRTDPSTRTNKAPADANAEANDTSPADEAPSSADGLPMDDDLHDPPTLPSLLRRYGVNVMVSRPSAAAAPVVEETNPTYANLMGRIDMGMRENVAFTDHMLLKPGSMHKAVGGFLVLQAHDVVHQPGSWHAVRRMVRFGRIELENSSESDGRTPGATIRPQPIRADVKVILIGDWSEYNSLTEGDPEFRQNFKALAEFDDEMLRNTESETAYAQLAGAAARTRGYPEFTSEAVALLIEEGSRWTEDQDRLSAKLDDVRDFCAEAGYFAKRSGEALTRSEHVKAAIHARDRRAGLQQEKLEQGILRHELLVSTQGGAVGQINGLGVYSVEGYSFGVPSRITATISPGMAGVVTIDREAELSTRTHTKGVLTLAGYLAGRFARDFPLSLSASLAFEQVFGVDGDSASSAELYALLSALADVPIRQSLAVTGSVNQHGEAQVIGGVNEKIEGFFRICQQRGLTGEQGVIIPRANAHNLMLRDEVIEAAQAGVFHIFTVNTIEEGIQLLTGIPFGTPTSDGRYLEGTIAARVLQRLRNYSELVRYYAGPFGGAGPTA